MSRVVALPASALLVLRAWYEPKDLALTRFRVDTLEGWLFGLLRNRAVTLNGVVHLTTHAPALGTAEGIALAAHELFHVVQQRDMGWGRFLRAYIRDWPFYLGSRVIDHPLEAPVYARGAEAYRAAVAQGIR